MGLFKKKKDFLHIEVKQLIEWNEPNGEGCVVSDKITKEGYKVGYMFREEPNPNYPDSGWNFLAGDENDDYMNDSDNHHIFAINTVCNYDQDIIPYLHAPAGTAYIRSANGKFEVDDGTKPIVIEKQ